MSLSKKAAKAKQLPVKKSIVQWCKEQAAQDKELTMRWEGGGDSGWVYFEIDGESADNEYTRALVDKMDDTLDYGSWAGEFSASGEATYDPTTNSFTGTDYYGEDSHDVVEANIIIRVPKSFWFDTLHLECECNYDETPETSVQFIIKNGFLTQEHRDFCSNLEGVFRDDLDNIFSNYRSSMGHDFRGCTDSWMLERNEAEEDGDELVFTINKIDIQVMDSDDRTVVLELDTEMAESIDERLNDEEDGY